MGGDWWNKCGDGWLNADFIFMRLPVGFVCEDRSITGLSVKAAPGAPVGAVIRRFVSGKYSVAPGTPQSRQGGAGRPAS